MTASPVPLGKQWLQILGPGEKWGAERQENSLYLPQHFAKDNYEFGVLNKLLKYPLLITPYLFSIL